MADSKFQRLGKLEGHHVVRFIRKMSVNTLKILSDAIQYTGVDR